MVRRIVKSLTTGGEQNTLRSSKRDENLEEESQAKMHIRGERGW